MQCMPRNECLAGLPAPNDCFALIKLPLKCTGERLWQFN